MALVRSFEDREYWPEYGTFLVRDAGPPVAVRVGVGQLLQEYATDAQPCGSIARAGDGWLDGAASDRYHAVRMEAHDGPPEDDVDDWADVVETPFATGGTVGLAMVIGGTLDQFRLGPPGLYRVRFARRAADGADGDLYRLQFWPAAAPVDPPRWLARSAPPVSESAPDARGRYCDAASDLTMLALWAREAELPTTLRWLADRLRTSPATVRDIIGYAVRAGLLDVGDDPDDPDDPLLLTVRPRRPQPSGPRQPVPQPAPAATPLRVDPPKLADRPEPADLPRSGDPASVLRARATFVATARTDRDAEPPQPPLGAPPRAGVVGSDGAVVVWRDGQPAVLTRWSDASILRAFESRYGIVLLGSDQTVLVRSGGGLELIGTHTGLSGAIDRDGRHLAVVESHLGRRSWSRLHLVDLADLSRQTMPWDERDAWFAVTAVRDRVVYFRPGTGATTMRWTPGTEPEPLPYLLRRLDPQTGTALATGGGPGLLLVRPDGPTRRLTAEPQADLAPGGQLLYAYRSSPPEMKIRDLTGAAEHPTVHPLPPGSRVDAGAPGGPVWEDATHLLVPSEHRGHPFGTPAVRLDVRTGAVEGVPLPPEAAYRPIFVEPFSAEDQERSA